MDRPCRRCLGYPEFILSVRGQRVLRHQLFRDRAGDLRLHPALYIDAGELPVLGRRIGCQLALLPIEVGGFSIGLGTDGNILSSRHRHRTGDQPRESCQHDTMASGGGSCHPDDQAAGRKQAVVGAQHGGPQPANPPNVVSFKVWLFPISHGRLAPLPPPDHWKVLSLHVEMPQLQKGCAATLVFETPGRLLVTILIAYSRWARGRSASDPFREADQVRRAPTPLLGS